MSHTVITLDGHTVSITGPYAELLADQLLDASKQEENIMSDSAIVVLVIVTALICAAVMVSAFGVLLPHIGGWM